jgi:hypothetical protein
MNKPPGEGADDGADDDRGDDPGDGHVFLNSCRGWRAIARAWKTVRTGDAAIAAT